ncbi:alpha/beta hydrolase family protein [Cytobacillus sp. Hz8]|uniref:alpha/beta hydrolase family protein n=1 Tax=Cytobacillus sp. Hz8 TaxID=3347168 RepID=UPI0035DF3F01
MSKHFHVQWEKEELMASMDFPNDFNPFLRYPLIIICHGFIGSRIGVNRLFVKTADELVRDGFIVIRFDYAGCGESTGIYGGIGLSGMIEQTQAVIQYARALSFIEQDNITLLGHSLGGATALLTAIHDNNIRNLILWSAVGQPFEDIELIIGKKNVDSLETKDKINYLGYDFTNSYFQSLKKYHPLFELKGYSGNVLLIHGTADEEIPVTYCAKYEQSFLNREKGTVIRKEIKGANHIFSDGGHFVELLHITKEWLSRQQQIATNSFRNIQP